METHAVFDLFHFVEGFLGAFNQKSCISISFYRNFYKSPQQRFATCDIVQWIITLNIVWVGLYCTISMTSAKPFWLWRRLLAGGVRNRKIWVEEKMPIITGEYLCGSPIFPIPSACESFGFAEVATLDDSLNFSPQTRVFCETAQSSCSSRGGCTKMPRNLQF